MQIIDMRISAMISRRQYTDAHGSFTLECRWNADPQKTAYEYVLMDLRDPLQMGIWAAADTPDVVEGLRRGMEGEEGEEHPDALDDRSLLREGPNVWLPNAAQAARYTQTGFWGTEPPRFTPAGISLLLADLRRLLSGTPWEELAVGDVPVIGPATSEDGPARPISDLLYAPRSS